MDGGLREFLVGIVARRSSGAGDQLSTLVENGDLKSGLKTMGVWAPGPPYANGNDVFTGDGINDIDSGELGKDNLIGGTGNDTLDGKFGECNGYTSLNSCPNVFNPLH
jgi:hypothetical protein